jgi:ABC-2 type transport system ATP-binding protein
VLDEGRVIAEGTAQELKARVGSETVELFFADLEALGEAALVLEDASVDLERLSLRVAGDGSAACVKALLEGVDGVERLDLHRPTLDEAFLTLTERTPA